MKKEAACKKMGEVLTQIRLDLNAILLLCKEHQEIIHFHGIHSGKILLP